MMHRIFPFVSQNEGEDHTEEWASTLDREIIYELFSNDLNIFSHNQRFPKQVCMHLYGIVIETKACQ